MKPMTRIATAAAALALFVAPAAFASEGTPKDAHCRAQAAGECACTAEHSTRCGQAMEQKRRPTSRGDAAHGEPRAQPSTPERQEPLRH